MLLHLISVISTLIFSKELLPILVFGMWSITTPCLPLIPNSKGWAPESEQSPRNIPDETREKMLFVFGLQCWKDASLEPWTAIFPSSAKETIYSKRVCGPHTKRSRKRNLKDEERPSNIVWVSELNCSWGQSPPILSLMWCTPLPFSLLLVWAGFLLLTTEISD